MLSPMTVALGIRLARCLLSDPDLPFTLLAHPVGKALVPLPLPLDSAGRNNRGYRHPWEFHSASAPMGIVRLSIARN